MKNISLLLVVSLLVSCESKPQKNTWTLQDDKIVIETTKAKGYGLFSRSIHPTHNTLIDTAHKMHHTLPKMEGVPDNLQDLYIDFINLDIVQNFYQNYQAGNITREYYDYMISAWKADTSALTANMLKAQVGVLFGKDQAANTIMIVDQNNNHNFADDQQRILAPPKANGQFWSEFGDSSLIQVDYEYFDGQTVQQSHSWLYLDRWPAFPAGKEPAWFKKNPFLYAYSHAEYSQGVFKLGNEEYQIAIKRAGSAYRIRPQLILSSAAGEVLSEDKVTINDYIEIQDMNYVFASASPDGRYITLVKEAAFVKQNPSIITENTQIGFKAKNFSAKTIDDQNIELKDFRGQYVLLDFWGTWCGPCRDEIPTLRKVYSKYQAQGFVLIGVAKDRLEQLNKYLKQEQITWPQILQDEDHSIIDTYNVFGYPTTYLIDPEGTIIARNLRGKALEERLAAIYAKETK